MPEPRLRPFRGVGAVLAVLLLVQAASAAVLFALKLGLTARDVGEFYLGSEARFTPPRSAAGLLEVAIPHLVAIPLLVFAVAHVAGFLGGRCARLAVIVARVSFASALAGVLAGFGVRYLWPALSWAKVGSFCALEGTLLAWLGLTLWIFFGPARAEAAVPGGAAAGPALATRARGSAS